MNRIRNGALALASLTVFAACSSGGVQGNSGYVAPEYVDANASVAGVSGIGFESQDIRELTDKMVRDLLTNPQIANASTPARVIIDDTRFVNESNQVVNLNLLLDRMRIELLRASQGRIQFVSRQNVDMVEKEKALKASGKVDAGRTDVTRAVAGADYHLTGKITSQTTTSNKTGVKANYYQFSFEMLDLNNGLVVWANLFDVKKAGADDRIYHD